MYVCMYVYIYILWVYVYVYVYMYMYMYMYACGVVFADAMGRAKLSVPPYLQHDRDNNPRGPPPPADDVLLVEYADAPSDRPRGRARFGCCSYSAVTSRRAPPVESAPQRPLCHRGWLRCGSHSACVERAENPTLAGGGPGADVAWSRCRCGQCVFRSGPVNR